MEKTTNYFENLNSIDVNGKTEKKNGLTYLSWAWAWGELKKRHPDAVYTIYENTDGWNYHTDGKTAWVKTGVTVNGIEHIEYLPVMDYRNKSIELKTLTSFDVNKAIQRSLTKAVARHGLGLYIYAGEDLPDCDKDSPKKDDDDTVFNEPTPEQLEEFRALEGNLENLAIYFKLPSADFLSAEQVQEGIDKKRKNLERIQKEKEKQNASTSE